MLQSTKYKNRFLITDAGLVKQKVLNAAKSFSTFCFLDNQGYSGQGHRLDALLAAGLSTSFQWTDEKRPEDLDAWLSRSAWRFGHINYEFGDQWHRLPAEPQNALTGFPPCFFFEPEILIRLAKNELIVECGDPDQVIQMLEAESTEPEVKNEPAAVRIRARYSKEEYLEIIHKLKAHIHRGDCYEINFCQEFYAENKNADPFQLFRKLVQVSPNPFSALYRHQDQWLICASPERFLQKNGSRLISQPIKGTAARKKQDDADTAAALAASAKDLAENVMVVDLVRNDLSRVCSEGTVKADELFGIYSFPQVHQMISTVSGELKPGTTFTEILQALFPMGSMTGAPKEKVMELIRIYEKTKRGLFSGSVGYFSPDGNFDFNVVIRSILFNQPSGYISFPAGSGITWYSDPETEWEECLMKLKAIRQVLGAEE